MKVNRKIVILVVLTLTLVGCGGDGGGDGVIGTGNSPIFVAGAAQKGPFVLGSRITIERLTANGKPTGDSTFTTTSSDIGSFTFDLSEPGLVQIFADGYHFDEISGALSKGPITLRAMLDATGDTLPLAYVNVLTHIAYNRQMKLIQAGTASTETLSQAQSELVNALMPILPSGKFPQFTDMSLYNAPQTSPAANAYLVALSAVAYQYATEKALNNKSSVDAELTLLLNSLADDFGHDGTIENNALVTDLITASRHIDPDSVRANLKLRAQQAGQNDLDVPDLNLFIDTDGDGAVNAEDPDDDNDGLPDDVDPHPYVKDVVTSNLANLSGVTSVSSVTELQANVSYPQLVVKLEYLVNGVPIGEATSPPYSITWNPYFWGDEGTVHVSIRTTDITGNVSESAPVAISVSKNVGSLLVTQPLNGTVIRDTARPVLKWSMTGSAHHYDIQLWPGASASNYVVNETISSTELLAPKLASGTYYWRVRASTDQGNYGPWSASYQVTIAGPLPPTATLPLANSVYRNANQVDLSWTPSPFSVFYAVRLTNVTTTSTLVFENSTLDSNMPSTPLEAGTYEWSVRSANADAVWGDWSNARRFTFAGPVPPVLVTPDVAQTLPSNQEIVFEWTGSEYAINYEVQISKAENYSNLIVSTTTTGKSYSVELDTGVYYFRIRAQNELAYWGSWSNASQIKIGVFTKKYIEIGTSSGNRIVRTSNGGYVITGRTQGSWLNFSAVLLRKIDSLGNVVWNRVFDTEISEAGVNVIQTSDGGYLVATDVWDGAKAQTGVIKTNSQGEEQWSAIRPNARTGFGIHTTLLEDSDGYVVGGTSTKPPRGDGSTDSTPYLWKIGNDGKELWSYIFDDSTTDFESLGFVAAEADGSYLILGNLRPPNAQYVFDNSLFIAHLGADHSTFSNIALPRNELTWWYFSGASRLENGDLLLATTVPPLSTYAYRLRPDGSRAWFYSFGSNGFSSGDLRGVIFREGETSFFGSSGIADGTYRNAGQVVTIDADGLELRSTNYESVRGSINLNDMTFANDGGQVLLGQYTTSTDNSSGILVIKTDPLGVAPDLSQPINIDLGIP